MNFDFKSVSLHPMKIRIADKIYTGLAAGLTAPVLVVAILYLALFNYLTIGEFITQAILLKVQFKIIAIGVFFADLGLFFLFLRLNKNNASKGVILSVFFYFFLTLIL